MLRRYNTSRAGGCGLSGGRILIALVVAGIALVSYFSMRVYNPVTGETQHINITENQEVAIGLQAAPEMAQEYGGLSSDTNAQAKVDQICSRIVSSSDASQTSYHFQCHLLADAETVNAFALPGGQVFMTEGLYALLTSEGQLAGVLGHEIGHVVGRHGAEQMAQTELTQGLTGAVVLASYDPNNPNSQYAGQVAMLVGQLVNLKYSRSDELEADKLGVRLMSQAKYDPRAMVQLMQILEDASQGDRPPEFFSTHPNPENRMTEIQQAIDEQYPQGVPPDLQP
jgi:beta-barrel assembly-enhancing protease